MKRLRPHRDILLLLLFALAVRLALALVTNNERGDPDCRAYMSGVWAYHPKTLVLWIWLPYYFYVTGALTHVFGNPALAGKVLSLVAGTLTIIPLYSLSMRFFGKTAAVVSGLIFAVFGMHVKMSCLTMTEAPFAFLCLSAIALFYSGAQAEKPRARRLFVSALLLGLAGLLRHEAWALAVILTVFLLWQPSLRRYAVLYGLFAAAPFILMGAIDYATRGAFTYRVTELAEGKEAESPAVRFPVSVALRKWLNIFVTSPGPIVMLLAAIGLWYAAIARKASAQIALIAVILMGPIFVLSLIIEGWLPQARHLTFFELLMLPYAGLGFHVLFSRRKAIGWAAAAVVVLTCASQAVVYSYKGMAFGLPIDQRGRREIQVAEFLKPRLTPRERLLVEDYSREAAGIMLGCEAYKYTSEGADNWKRMLRLSKEMKPTLLVVHAMDPKRIVGGAEIERIYSNERYRVYRVNY
ncbi:MAG: glycosyltransferase family 39 protein [Armatimonadota bacterium]|nr:glycosyltransferase family 39 protein [Armatimonadota bacterium]